MDGIWRAAERAVCFLSRYSTVILAAVGIGLVRTMFGFLLGVAAEQSPLYDRHLMIDAGEVLVFVSLAAIVRLRGPLCRRSWPVLLGIAMLAVTLVLETLGQSGSLPWGVTAVGDICAGATYAVLLLVWLEVCGCTAPVEAVLAIAGSYAVSLVGWLLLQPGSPLAGRVAVFILACISVFLLVTEYFMTPGDALPTPFQGGIAGASRVRTSISGPILAWMAILSFVYGFGDTFTQMGFSTWPSKVGMALPFVLIGATLLWLRERFDLRMLYRTSLTLMLVGVLPVLLLGSFHAASQILMSAAQASMMVVAFAFACTSARRRHESALFGCGVLSAISLVATLVGNGAGAAFVDACFPLSEPMARVAGAAIVFAMMFLAAFLMHDQDLSSLIVDTPEAVPAHESDAGRLPERAHQLTGKDTQAQSGQADLRTAFSRMPDEGPLREAVLERATVQAGLSKRETVVFLLMAQGRSIAQIGDELFIAQGTVRAHMSRIYDKLGVHSREEFARLLGE